MECSSFRQFPFQDMSIPKIDNMKTAVSVALQLSARKSNMSTFQTGTWLQFYKTAVSHTTIVLR